MIKAKDSNEVKNFFLNRFSEIKSILQNNYDVQLITFGEKIHFNPDTLSFNEVRTNAEKLFSEPQQTLGNKPISAMIIFTDGIFNEGIHPISLAENISYPIYIAASGDTNIYKDIAIRKILHNKNVFLGNDFIVEVLLHSSDIKNEKIEVSIHENKNELSKKTLIINSDMQNINSVQFQLNANKAGYHSYKVSVSVIKDEKNIYNNTAYFIVHVIENKIKTLFLYSAPHPDISAIRQILHTSEQYATEAYSETSFNKNINDYDVILFHSPDPNYPLYKKCLQSNIPLMLITTSLHILQNQFLNIKQLSLQPTNETEAHLNTSFSAFSLTEDYKEFNNTLPILLTPYGEYTPIGETDILYYQKINNIITDLPLFFLIKNNVSKYAIFLGDGLWRWKMNNYQTRQNTEWFSHLITQTIRYLSIKRDKSPFKVHIPPTINENEPLQITAELLNESMQNITEPDVFLKLEDEAKHEYKYVFNKSNTNYFLNAGTLPAGEYTYKAHTQYKTKAYSQTGKLHIIPLSIEQNNLSAQHHLLKTLSQKTNGKLYLLKDSETILQDLSKNEDIKTIVTQTESYQYWIDNQWWFFIIVLLAITEWVIRRWHGIV